MTASDALIVALDVPNALKGEEMAGRLEEHVGFFKVGLGMLTGGGFALANELKDRGHRVFLDMKLFDIADTVTTAVEGIARFDIDFLTVHGDPHVVRAAVRGRATSKTKILAVTVLTSLDRDDLDDMMIETGEIEEIVVERARRALIAGADGVIASPWEAKLIRGMSEANGKLIVCPGIRPEGAQAFGQKRISTPADAIAAGADHVVVGRPIIAAVDPTEAARAMQAEIAAALG